MNDADRFAEVGRLFEAVCDLPHSDRVDRLIELAPDDEGLRSEVLAMLRAESNAEALAQFDSGPLAVEPAGVAEDPDVIAGYRIVAKLGAGGMGIVYEAEQHAPKRRVALKLLRPGVMTDELVRRFEFEAEALARLRHPGVAQIYEAGVADSRSGPRPYFAMELVRGEPMDAWARAQPVAERLRAVAAVCDAVQHAHAQGVMHRDLKPANILVPKDGGPKVLDFGVARVVDRPEQHVTFQTTDGQLVGTLPYMSPELVSGDRDRVDTRSDVYALGVVLFELLSGRLMHDLDGLGLVEAARVIQDSEPTRLASLEPRLRGDIDTIVRTATAKEPDRRYPTAAAMAQDIRRYLDGQTITARPASAVYQISRLAKRHRTAVVAIVFAAAAVVTAGVVSTASFLRERELNARLESQNASIEASLAREGALNTELTRQNANFEATISFLEDMLLNANPDAGGEMVTLLDMLDVAAEEIREGGLKSEEVEASLRTTLGSTYGWLGYFDDAVDLLTPALPVRQELGGELSLPALDTLKLLARFTSLAGDPESALALIGDTHDRFAQVADPNDRKAMFMLGDLLRVRAVAMKHAGQTKEIEPTLLEAAEVYEGLRLADGSYETGGLGEVYNELGTLRRHQMRFDEAEAYYKQALEIYAETHGEETERYASVLNNYSLILNATGRREEAIESLGRSLAISDGIYGEETPGRSMTVRSNYGNSLARLGRYAEAEPVLRRALREHLAVLPADHPNIAFPQLFLADTLVILGENEEAAALAEEGIERLTGQFGPTSAQAVMGYATLGWALEAVGRQDEGVRALAASLKACEASYGPETDWSHSSRLVLACALVRSGATDEARALISRVEQAGSSSFSWRIHRAYGMAAIEDGDREAGLAHLDAWWAAMLQRSHNTYELDADWAARARIALLVERGRHDEAEACVRYMNELAEVAFGADHPALPSYGLDF